MIKPTVYPAKIEASGLLVPQAKVDGFFQRPIGSLQAFATISLYGALVAGTGGLFASTNAVHVEDWTKWPIIQVRSSSSVTKKEEDVSVPSVVDHLRLVRDGFGLKMSELAQLFGVSRQAAYGWFNGTLPRPEIVTRIWKLSRSAEELRISGIRDVGQFIHRPLLENGDSLHTVIMSGRQLDEAIAVVKNLGSAEAKVRSEATVRNLGAVNARNSSFVELAKPVFYDWQS